MPVTSEWPVKIVAMPNAAKLLLYMNIFDPVKWQPTRLRCDWDECNWFIIYNELRSLLMPMSYLRPTLFEFFDSLALQLTWQQVWHTIVIMINCIVIYTCTVWRLQIKSLSNSSAGGISRSLHYMKVYISLQGLSSFKSPAARTHFLGNFLPSTYTKMRSLISNVVRWHCKTKRGIKQWKIHCIEIGNNFDWYNEPFDKTVAKGNQSNLYKDFCWSRVSQNLFTIITTS